jgi:PAS domain S-box-containing protein
MTVSTELLLNAYPSDMLLKADGMIVAAGKRWSDQDVVGKQITAVFPSLWAEFQACAQELSSGNQPTVSFIAEGHQFELTGMSGLFYLKCPTELPFAEAFSDVKYRQLFDLNMAAVFMTSTSGEIIEVNKSYAHVFGFDTIEELKKHKSSEFYPDLDTRERYIQQLKEKKNLRNYRIRNRNAQGNDIYLLANVSLLEENGEEFIVGTLIDVTEQTLREHQLELTNNELLKYSAILDNISDTVQVTDEEGTIVFLNAEAKKRLGVHDFKLGTLTVFDFSPYFQTREQFKEHFLNFKEGETLVTRSEHKNLSTGELTPTELSIRLEQIGQKKYLIATGRDITQRLLDQLAIQERDKYIQELNKAINASSLVSVTDKEGRILEANDFFCKVSEYSRDELIGSNHRIVSSRTHTVDFWKEFYETICAGQIWTGEICNRKKSGALYWVRTVIFPVVNESGRPERFMSIRQDITAEKIAGRVIQKHVDFQDLLVRIAVKLINIDPNMLEEEVNASLSDIGRFVGADRAYIFDYDLKNETTSNTYEWCSEGIEPQLEYLQELPLNEFTDWTDKHFKGELLDIPQVALMPDSKTKELLLSQDIKSLIALPIMEEERCLGFIGFDAVRDVCTFTENDKNILDLFARMLVNIKKRIASIKEIEQANQQVREINENLESRIKEEMNKSAQLNQSLATMDKMAMIGELTSGLAHDLNTPLGAIKVGAESVRFTLENLFNEVLENSTIEQLHFACSRSAQENYNMFVGGIQTMRESRDLEEYLETHYTNIVERKALVPLFVKARITVEQPQDIEKVLLSDNPKEFLDLIYHIQVIRTFIDTILEAGEKAGSVVKSLRFYLKEGSDQEQLAIDLSENITTVINVFNHMIKDHEIELELDLQEGLRIDGYANRLYQLWSNLLKNAIEATGKNGRVSVVSKMTDAGIAVAVKNSGEPIPDEVRDKIWKKFFTTKVANGTGLGLNIVKRVVDEHGASIRLSSDSEGTEFTVQFPKTELPL